MLDNVTRRLLEIEVMEGHELRAILGVTPAPNVTTAPRADP
jgi:hypothetical protein